MARPSLKSAVKYISMERNNGIPNPDKYQLDIKKDIMPTKKFKVSRRPNEFKRIKNYQSFLKMNCKPQRIGVTGTKLIQKKFKINLKEIIIPKTNYNRTPKAKWNKNSTMNWDENIWCNDELLKNNIFKVRNDCWSIFTGRNNSVSSMYSTKKKKVIVKLNCVKESKAS